MHIYNIFVKNYALILQGKNCIMNHNRISFLSYLYLYNIRLYIFLIKGIGQLGLRVGVHKSTKFLERRNGRKIRKTRMTRFTCAHTYYKKSVIMLRTIINHQRRNNLSLKHTLQDILHDFHNFIIPFDSSFDSLPSLITIIEILLTVSSFFFFFIFFSHFCP